MKPIYTINDLIQESNKKKLKYVFFWGHQPARNNAISKSCFSQWWKQSFEVDGIVFKTAEHWMMYHKAILFNNPIIAEQILKAHKPAKAKQLGREVLGFNAAEWDRQKFDIVVNGNYHKFSQNPALKQFLIETKQKVIVEASPVDKIWGIGLAEDHPNAKNPRLWKGENLLGFALMKVRDQLKNEIE